MRRPTSIGWSPERKTRREEPLDEALETLLDLLGDSHGWDYPRWVTVRLGPFSLARRLLVSRASHRASGGMADTLASGASEREDLNLHALTSRAAP